MGDNFGEGRLLDLGDGDCPLGRLTLAGVVRDGGGLPRFRRGFDTFALVLQFGEGGWFEDESGFRRRVGAGDAFVLTPNCVGHRYGPSGESRWDEIYVCFEGKIFELWRQNAILREPYSFLPMQPATYWFGKLMGVLEEGLTGLERVARLQAVLAEVLREAEGEEGEGTWLRAAKKAVMEHVDGAVDYAAVARSLGVSYETFRKRFAALEGRSPHRFRLDSLIEKACDLMHRESLTNAQLADRLGFCNEYHFSRLFKKRMGVSPGVFRGRVRVRGNPNDP